MKGKILLFPSKESPINAFLSCCCKADDWMMGWDWKRHLKAIKVKIDKINLNQLKLIELIKVGSGGATGKAGKLIF